MFVVAYGRGVLITGPSGAGKSECALALIKDGAVFVADDLVHVSRHSNYLKATANPLGHNKIYLKDLGLINVAQLFGKKFVRKKHKLDLVIEFTKEASQEIRDPLHMNQKFVTLLGLKIPHIKISTMAPRNLAVLVEVAIKNETLKASGINAAALFYQKINSLLTKKRHKAISSPSEKTSK